MNAEVEVVVTGVGAVTCHGVGAGELWRAMTAAGTRLPDRPADPLALMDLPLINLVPDLDLPGLDPTSERATRFASLAAAEALADAGLDADALDAVRSAVVLGSCMGEPGVNERERGGQRWEPPFRLASALADELGLFGTALDVANACAAGGYALGVAMDLVRAGEADVVIAGVPTPTRGSRSGASTGSGPSIPSGAGPSRATGPGRCSRRARAWWSWSRRRTPGPAGRSTSATSGC